LAPFLGWSTPPSVPPAVISGPNRVDHGYGEAGRESKLIFSTPRPPQVTHGSDLLMAGNFVATQSTPLSLVSNWPTGTRPGSNAS
jgi:hypothetical protein